MKRILLVTSFLCLFVYGAFASELNIYASGLRLHGSPAVTGENQVHIDYFLNAPATDLKFVVLDASTGDELTSVTIPAGTENANYAKGSHSDVVVDLSAFYGAGETYKWAIKATAAANASLTKISDTSTRFLFYSPQGLAVDNSPESDYLGRIYVAESRTATTSAQGTRSQKEGIYIFGPDLTDITSQGDNSYNGSVAWNESTTDMDGNGWVYGMYGPARISVADDGCVFICDNGRQSAAVNTSGVWMMDPASPSTAFKEVLDVSKRGTVFNRANSCVVIGSGADKVLYLVDWSDSIMSYPVGNCTTPYSSKGTTWRNNLASFKIVNALNTLVRGINDDFWVFQFRSSLDAYPIITHFNASAERDFWIDNTNNSSLAPSTNPCRRGCGAVSPDGSKLAFYGNTTMYIYDVAYNASGVPSLSNKKTIASVGGSNVDAIAFDMANNIYFASASNECFFAYSTPKTTNTCTTPAASSRTIVLESYVPPVDVTGVALDETSKTLVKGQDFTLTATVSPEDATNKNVTWTSSDPTVASVSNGVVTALKKGTTTITATSADNSSFYASCAVTVDLLHGTYKIGGAEADYATLADACEAIDNIGIDGNVTLLICDNLTETRNSGLINGTDYSITIRPDADANRKVLFTKSTDNSGPSGAFIIGCDMRLVAVDSPTNNVIIDGYAEGGSTRRLTFEITSGFGSAWGPIIYYGQTEGCVVRNTNIINTQPTGASSYAIILRPANATNHTPTGVVIENNYIENKTHNVGQAIELLGTQATSSAGYPTGTVIRNNEIVASARGVFFNKGGSTTIEGNTFRIRQKSAALLSHGVLGNDEVGTIIVRNNKFIELPSTNTSEGPYGMRGVTASGGATVWMIENNYFAGLDATAAAGKSIELVYVRCGDSCRVRHNTFYMPALTQKPSTTLTNASPISCLYLAGTKKYHVENNIFVSAETTANNSLIRGGLNPNVKNNIYYHAGGNAAIIAGTPTYTTWDDFTVADAGSKWKEPVFANAAAGDLAIAEADNDLKVARLADILKDLFGNDRANPTYAGACEPVGVTNITGVSSTLTLEDINDTHAFTAVVLPANTSFPTVYWSSSDEAVATVSSSGVVTARGQGTTTVTATAGGFAVNCLVTVNATHSLSGTYRIGGDGADFATLHAACAQAGQYGLKGNTTFLICADLSETQNSGIVNTTDYTLTIRPDAAVKRTVSFGSAPDNDGPSGHIMIGYNLTGWGATDTKNVIIDGSYNGSGQYLEFQGGTIGGVVVVYYGHVTNSVVRNCRLISPRTSGTTYVVHFRSEKSSDKTPDGVGFENCYMQVTGVANAQAVFFNGSESATSAGKPKDCYVRGCEIVTNLRGIFFNGATNAVIEGNTFRMPAASGGYIAHAIMGNAQTGAIVVRGNRFAELVTTNTNTGAFGIRAITAAGGGNWTIENNWFGGMDASGSVAGKNILLTYLYCDNLCTVRHNTFHMPVLSNKPGNTLASDNPIACVRLKAGNSHVIENNLFVSDETAANNSLISGTLTTDVSGNVFCHAGGNAAVTTSATAFADLASTYKDANAWMSVTFADTYKPDFESASNTLMAVTPISGITTDIEGRTRNTPTHAGCYDPSWGIVLDETADDNGTTIAAKDGETVDVMLKRQFSAGDTWYTLVLPFDMTAAQMTEVFGAGYRLHVLQDSYFKTETMLYLKFNAVTALPAGTPCLFRPGVDITENVIIHDVTIDDATADILTTEINMLGIYDQTDVPASELNYYLGSNNYLYRYRETKTTKGFRAYFHLNQALPQNCSARVVFQDETPTDMEDVEMPEADSVRKIIRNGQVVIIRGGVEYNAQGMRIK